jgi:hypothetical protein
MSHVLLGYTYTKNFINCFSEITFELGILYFYLLNLAALVAGFLGKKQFVSWPNFKESDSTNNTLGGRKGRG